MKLVKFAPKPKEPEITIQEVVDRAMAEGLTDVIVLGWTNDGDAHFGSTLEYADALWLMKQAELMILEPED